MAGKGQSSSLLLLRPLAFRRLLPAGAAPPSTAAATRAAAAADRPSDQTGRLGVHLVELLRGGRGRAATLLDEHEVSVSVRVRV